MWPNINKKKRCLLIKVPSLLTVVDLVFESLTVGNRVVFVFPVSSPSAIGDSVIGKCTSSNSEKM